MEKYENEAADGVFIMRRDGWFIKLEMHYCPFREDGICHYHLSFEKCSQKNCPLKIKEKKDVVK